MMGGCANAQEIIAKVRTILLIKRAIGFMVVTEINIHPNVAFNDRIAPAILQTVKFSELRTQLQHWRNDRRAAAGRIRNSSNDGGLRERAGNHREGENHIAHQTGDMVL